MTLIDLNGKKLNTPQVTYQSLLDIHNAIQRWDAATFFFMRSKRQEFYRVNGKRIESMLQFIHDLKLKYCLIEKNEQGKEVFVIENGKHKFETPEREQEFIEKYNEYMNQPCKIE